MWSGIWADFATAPPSSPSATRLSAVEDSPGAAAKTASKSSEPVCQIRTKNASAIVASPKAFITKAFLAAATASARSCQNPISRYDASPTSPQPTSRSRKLPAWTSISIAKTKSDM